MKRMLMSMNELRGTSQEERKNAPIKSFTDLRVWQEGHLFVLDIYRLTKKFPQDETFGLISQLRRAAISFTSNIAEGFSRKTPKDRAQFYTISLGSLTEIQNQLLIARDIGYSKNDEFQKFAEKSVTLSKMMNGLIKATLSRSS